MYNNTPEQLKNNEEISLNDIVVNLAKGWNYLVANLKFILIIGFGCAMLGFIYAYFIKPSYTAEYSFVLEDEKSSGGGLGSALGLASQFGIDLGASGGGAFSGDNLLELMKSRNMIEKALLTPVKVNGKMQTLADVYMDIDGWRDRWFDNDIKQIHFLPGVSRDKFSLKQDSLLGEFHKEIISKNLMVDKIDKKLSIIIVKVTSSNQIFSSNLAEILVNVVSRFYIETKIKKSTTNVNILQHQVDSVRSQLNSAINGVANSSDLNPNANPALQILKTPSQRHQFDVQANTTILGELVKNLELAKISLRKETPLIMVIDKPQLPLERKKTSKAIFSLAGFFIGSLIAAIILFIKR